MRMDFRGQVWKRMWKNDIFWSEIGSGLGELDSTPQPKIPRITSGTLTRKLQWNLDITKGQGNNPRASFPGRSGGGTEKKAPERPGELDCEHPSDFEENKRLGRTSGEWRGP